MQLFLFLFPLQHMKRPALQNKQVVLYRMAFWARKVLGTFVKRAPNLKQPLPEPEPKRQCSFSLCISEKLASFDRRTRMLAEKRISDIIFEIEMSNDQVLRQNWNSDHMTQSTGRYMDMLHNSQQMYR